MITPCEWSLREGRDRSKFRPKHEDKVNSLQLYHTDTTEPIFEGSGYISGFASGIRPNCDGYKALDPAEDMKI